MKTIPVGIRGDTAFVDDADFDILSKFNWSLLTGKSGIKYAYRRVARKETVYMHAMVLPAPKGMSRDHINHNGLDNQRKNLRLATQTQNNANRRVQIHSSRFKGVCWDKTRKLWLCRIKQFGKTIHIGRFSDEIEAALSYDRKLKQLFGEFAHTNF